MSDTYRVQRQHLGDRLYLPGDERTADADTVRHLVENGVLVKAEPATKNKAQVGGKNKAAG
nr:hypothetical protein [uncultured Brevundimonas sp.]